MRRIRAAADHHLVSHQELFAVTDYITTSSASSPSFEFVTNRRRSFSFAPCVQLFDAKHCISWTFFVIHILILGSNIDSYGWPHDCRSGWIRDSNEPADRSSDPCCCSDATDNSSRSQNPLEIDKDFVVLSLGNQNLHIGWVKRAVLVGGEKKL